MDFSQCAHILFGLHKKNLTRCCLRCCCGASTILTTITGSHPVRFIFAAPRPASPPPAPFTTRIYFKIRGTSAANGTQLPAVPPLSRLLILHPSFSSSTQYHHHLAVKWLQPYSTPLYGNNNQMFLPRRAFPLFPLRFRYPFLLLPLW